MCLSYWLQVSDGAECGPAGFVASSSLLLLSLGCLCAGMSASWEFSWQGFFLIRATDSSWRLGTAPGWAGATGEANGGCEGNPYSSAFKPWAQFPPSLETQTSVSPLCQAREPQLLEL